MFTLLVYLFGVLLSYHGHCNGLLQFGEGRPNLPLWTVIDAQTNTSCIIFDGILNFIVEYDTVDGMSDIATVSVPASAKASGNCSHGVQTMILTWGSAPNVATFVFTRNSSGGSDTSIYSSYYELHSISGEISANPIQFPNAAFPDQTFSFFAANDLGFMSAPVELSYYCRSVQYVEFNDTTVTLKLAHVQTEAFNDDPVHGDGKDFGPRSYCAADSLNMVVIILAYIIILSLVGMTILYIVQRRYKRMGYTRYK